MASRSTRVDSQTEVNCLKSNQEETDTRLVLYINRAQEQGYERVVVRSPDSDVFFILLYYAHTFQLTILFDTGSGNKRRLLNITEIAGELGDQYCQCLIGLYVFTGEDANFAFKGKGKVTPLKKLEKRPRYQASFQRLGDNWDLDNELVDQLENMYGYPRMCSTDDVRAVMVKKMVGDGDTITTSPKIDLSKLPPCRRSLLPHIKRVNYRVAQWKRSHIKTLEVPAPKDHGWALNEDILEPVWSEGPVMPSKVVYILASDMGDQQDNEDDSDLDDPDYQCPFSSDEGSDSDI